MDSITKTCSVDECNGKHKGYGYCLKHYQRWKHHKSPALYREIHPKNPLINTPTYHTWQGMKDRAFNPNSAQYNDYGGRGITVCNRWKQSFMDFYEDMGPRPEGLTIDRINNNLGYYCGKCADCIDHKWPMNLQWADRYQQNWNQRPKANRYGYIGIQPYKYKGGKWTVTISATQPGGIRKSIYIGQYDTDEEAAIAYDMAVIFYRGNGYPTNFL